MFALNETATLHAFLGQRGGKPEWAKDGAAFRCRSEPAWKHRFSGSAIERAADTRIFAEGVDAQPGDRIALHGRYYRVAEAQPMRGWRGVHHMEILAKGEGPCREDG